MAVTRIEEGGLGTDSFNLPVTLNGTDGSSTDAGDNIVLDASASGVDAGERLLYEGIPPDIAGNFSSDVNVLSGVTFTIDSGATITNSGTASGFGATISNDANNRVTTADGSEGLNGEANLTFDGSTLTVTGALDVTTDITGLTLNADGDTSAGDNAAIGYTAAEGLILTGQGSTDDITIKNDADTTVMNVATGATDVEISAGNLLFGTGSKGVYLGVTSATAANLLDDYEEGTFTPTLGYYSGSAPTITYSSQSGTYTKIGRMVQLDISIGTTEHTGNTTYIMLQSLPFGIASSQPQGAGSVRWENMSLDNALGANTADVVTPVMYNASTDGILLALSQSGGSLNYVDGTDWPDSAANIQCSIVYQETS